ncbi:MAG: hypothetical protein WBG41_03765 [Acidimicrobiales bacterium]
MSDVQQGPDWWQASDGKWYPPERHPDYRTEPVAGPPPNSMVTATSPQVTRSQVQTAVERHHYTPPSYNELHMVHYKGGWIGLFGGESQEKALRRAIPLINASGQRVVAAVEDRWSFWKRIGVVLLLLITLGFVGRTPNVLLITEPMA